jgi:hypothetical protein
MELVLNLFWLSLLLPAYLLWRQRATSNSSSRRAKKPAAPPLLFACVIGCAIVLLFPVISASDDLHAMRPEMEESERAFRHAGHCATTPHGVALCSHLFVAGSTSATPIFAQIGTIATSLPQLSPSFSAPAPSGRAPPSEPLTAL